MNGNDRIGGSVPDGIKKKNAKGAKRSAAVFMTKLGAHAVHISEHLIRRTGLAVKHTVKLFKPAHDELLKAGRAAEKNTGVQNVTENTKDKKIADTSEKAKGKTAAAVFNIAFPLLSIAFLVYTVYSTYTHDYAVAVELDGNEIGTVASENVYSNAHRELAKIMDVYDTQGDCFQTARLTLKRISSNDKVMDEALMADSLKSYVASVYPVYEEPVEEELYYIPEEGELDENIVSAYMVRADSQIVGFVYEYDQIEAALEELKKPCLAIEGVTEENISFDKNITFEFQREIHKMAVVDQQAIINIIMGNEREAEYYEVAPGDNLWAIADAHGMTVEEIEKCVATYNGKMVSVGDNIMIGTIIELQSLAPFLTVEYSHEKEFEREIEFETVEKEDPELFIGEKVVDSEGEYGTEMVTADVTYQVVRNEDGTLSGKAVRRKIKGKEIISQPKARVIRIGTKEPDYAYGTYAGSGEYFWPVDGGYISSHYGGDRNHKGLDIAAPYGTPIFACAAGTVTDVGSGWNGGYGNCVVIQNDDGNITLYAHQSQTSCEVGDVVEAGQLIGYVGSTGDSTGNHLHLEVRSNGLYLDPEKFVAQ
ncbi:MAG: peptidoglycan DD-metalloendopeptidase family protein [Oscillospiraceae bacterium]|nr:peptidoglycan DD-metalloendopeptidase family protein [Oscillospiraceae bacterium]